MDKEQVINWLAEEANRNTVYHNHKETMAWVATALYITGAIAGGIQLHSIRLFIPFMLLIFMLITVAAFLFVNWQLNRRWVAASKTKALLHTITALGKDEIKTEELNWDYVEDKSLPQFVVGYYPKFELDIHKALPFIISNLVMLLAFLFIMMSIFHFRVCF